MGKDNFSDERHPREEGNRREREEYESIEQESAEDGKEMEKRGAHSNEGIGDEQNPIGESEEE
ncbi:hypothetical protein BN1080_00663 [Planococcus massiliensis]|uniref:Uncharacterized protein n=1 Tax=Planococcus massiliensis TaxID=1499687 RepID=A0A098EIW1_9BACL|nr:hypothetical protein [Planococcus massiliensis]CEG21747.1 hypothetical protein BN1080_00663 [Planococcus massiliensis]